MFCVIVAVVGVVFVVVIVVIATGQTSIWHVTTSAYEYSGFDDTTNALFMYITTIQLLYTQCPGEQNSYPECDIKIKIISTEFCPKKYLILYKLND